MGLVCAHRIASPITAYSAVTSIYLHLVLLFFITRCRHFIYCSLYALHWVYSKMNLLNLLNLEPEQQGSKNSKLTVAFLHIAFWALVRDLRHKQREKTSPPCIRLSCCTPLRAHYVIKSHMTKTLYGVCVLRRMAENVNDYTRLQT